MSLEPPVRWRPRLDAVWGLGISVVAAVGSGSLGAAGLSAVFALLAALFALYLLVQLLIRRWQRHLPRVRFPRTAVDFLLLLAGGGYLTAFLLGSSGWRMTFAIALGFLVLFYLGRWLGRVRARVLWRLRNRLLVTYLFIAFIPILLILGMITLTAYLLYGQLAGYLISTDLEAKAAELGAAGLALSAELSTRMPSLEGESAELARLLEREHRRLQENFGEFMVILSQGDRSVVIPRQAVAVPCHPVPPWLKGSFRGVVASQNRLFLHATVHIPGSSHTRLCLTQPVTEFFLAQVGANLGPFSLLLLEEVGPEPKGGRVFVIGDRTYVPGARLEPAQRTLAAPRYFFDPVLNGASKFNAVRWDLDSRERQELPVFLSITTRPSLLNQRIFAPLGEVAQALLTVLAVIGVVFLLLQVVSLVTGVRLTRSITIAVHDLYAATVRLQQGDFSVRIPHRRDDQLGALGDSFNQMAASIERLIEESKQRQRLEQELEIARQVQEQLFPDRAPELQTLRLVGHCRPALMVSGDYYDYGLAEKGRLIFTIGDISGKGISAALLMATIQSILRSQVYASRLMGQLHQLSMAELVTRLNRQLCATTSPEKYSTLFVGLYEDQTRQLTYTNAGHLPPFWMRDGMVRALDVGGPVVGVFSNSGYEQGTVELQAGDWVVAYTDGITEAMNSYDEEYGSERLLEFIQRTANGLSPERLIEAVLAEVQQWSPGAEASDDRTLLVARAA
jgi:sigma-B regulation protein RsbU (phosphoserine phosphatase)